jgi:hypothetical protein
MGRSCIQIPKGRNLGVTQYLLATSRPLRNAALHGTCLENIFKLESTLVLLFHVISHIWLGEEGGGDFVITQKVPLLNKTVM